MLTTIVKNIGIILLLTIGVSVSSAQSNDVSSFWGLWQCDDDFSCGSFMSIYFHPNGHFVMLPIEGIYWGTYTISENHLYLDGTSLYVAGPQPYSESYTFNLDNDILYLSSPETYRQLGPTTLTHLTGFADTGDHPCPAWSLASRMRLGFAGQIAYADGTPTRMRSNPSTSATILGFLQDGDRFYVIGGPACADGYTWWQVKVAGYSGRTGWVVEGLDYYFMEPEEHFSQLVDQPAVVTQQPVSVPVINTASLWGQWECAAEPNCGPLMWIYFHPNGHFVMFPSRGVYWGTYRVEGDTLYLDGSGEYLDVFAYSEAFSLSIGETALYMGASTLTRMFPFLDAGDFPCDGDALPSRLRLGYFANVTSAGSISLWNTPSASASAIATLEPVSGLTVIGGPACADGYVWWEVESGYNSNFATGWITESSDYYMVEPDKYLLGAFDQPASVEEASQAFTNAGATIYAPGTYPYINQLSAAIVNGNTANSFLTTGGLLTDAYIAVKEMRVSADPVSIVCMFGTLNDLGVQSEIELDSTQEAVCVFMDTVKYTQIGGPLVGGLYFLSYNLANPDKLIDPLLVDPVNEWVNSHPLLRLYCFVSADSCPPELKQAVEEWTNRH